MLCAGGGEASSKCSKRHEQSIPAPPTASGADQTLHKHPPVQQSHDGTEAVTVAAAPSAGRLAGCALQEVTLPAAGHHDMLSNVLTWQAACNSADTCNQQSTVTELLSIAASPIVQKVLFLESSVLMSYESVTMKPPVTSSDSNPVKFLALCVM